MLNAECSRSRTTRQPSAVDRLLHTSTHALSQASAAVVAAARHSPSALRSQVLSTLYLSHPHCHGQTDTILVDRQTTVFVSARLSSSPLTGHLSAPRPTAASLQHPPAKTRYTIAPTLRCERPSHSLATPKTTRRNGLPSTHGPERSSARLHPARRP
jgi:hypothetical protein